MGMLFECTDTDYSVIVARMNEWMIRQVFLVLSIARVGQSIPTIPPKQRFQFSLDIP